MNTGTADFGGAGDATLATRTDAAETMLKTIDNSTVGATGVSLFVVDARSPGVSIRSFTALDGQRVAELTLTNVAVTGGALVG